ncbi:hypothetical protein PISMIDRAFT_674106 [Pisolithus microcarpus 441]|uniref:Uncharacterized protein n=1 Tax=Pisolithus microcarpus 441 TaxID=765257 RepID=A0A0C9ZEP8_9AGAM|nr:hypothetical protein PISMIDRAFT_674106 [Pisolithus microcarpus 441]
MNLLAASDSRTSTRLDDYKWYVPVHSYFQFPFRQHVPGRLPRQQPAPRPAQGEHV